VSGQHHAPAALDPRGKDHRYPLDRRLGVNGKAISEPISKKVWSNFSWIITTLVTCLYEHDEEFSTLIREGTLFKEDVQ
jgi:hypothetical protein